MLDDHNSYKELEVVDLLCSGRSASHFQVAKFCTSAYLITGIYPFIADICETGSLLQHQQQRKNNLNLYLAQILVWKQM